MAEKKFRVVHYLNQFLGKWAVKKKRPYYRRPVTVLSVRGWG